MSLKFYLFSILIYFLFCINAISQEEKNNKHINKKALGGNFAVGAIYYKLPQGTSYIPAIFQGYYHQPLYKTKKWFNVSLNFVPQLNFAILKSKLYYEAGLNINMDFCFELSEKSLLSLNFGNGPHYITVDFEKQANGFIFCDNLFLAYRKKISDDTQISIFSGYRHMSNWGLKSPNAGIDNILIGVGISKFIGK
ncbi:MAG: acyloxyacyl hydrolase [Bacteroidota bacterium]